MLFWKIFSGRYIVKYNDGLKKTLHEHQVSNVHKVVDNFSLRWSNYNTDNIDKDSNTGLDPNASLAYIV